VRISTIARVAPFLCRGSNLKETPTQPHQRIVVVHRKSAGEEMFAGHELLVELLLESWTFHDSIRS